MVTRASRAWRRRRPGPLPCLGQFWAATFLSITLQAFLQDTANFVAWPAVRLLTRPCNLLCAAYEDTDASYDGYDDSDEYYVSRDDTYDDEDDVYDPTTSPSDSYGADGYDDDYGYGDDGENYNYDDYEGDGASIPSAAECHTALGDGDGEFPDFAALIDFLQDVEPVDVPPPRAEEYASVWQRVLEGVAHGNSDAEDLAFMLAEIGMVDQPSSGSTVHGTCLHAAVALFHGGLVEAIASTPAASSMLTLNETSPGGGYTGSAGHLAVWNRDMLIPMAKYMLVRSVAGEARKRRRVGGGESGKARYGSALEKARGHLSGNLRKASMLQHCLNARPDEHPAISALRKDADAGLLKSVPVARIRAALDDVAYATLEPLLEFAPSLLHARDSVAWTPLHGAAAGGLARTAALLVKYGADQNAVDGNERTPAHWASRFGYTDVLSELRGTRSTADMNGDLPNDLLPITAQRRIQRGKPVEHRHKDVHDDGGWRRTPSSSAVDRGCDVETLDVAEAARLTSSEFRARYLDRGVPVLLRGYANEWNVRKLWTRDALLNRRGEQTFRTGGIPYSMDFGLHEDGTTLAQFVKAMDQRDGRCSRHCAVNGALEMCHAPDAQVDDSLCTDDPLYIFSGVGEKSGVTEGRGVVSDFPSSLPRFLDGSKDDIEISNLQFFLGAENSGAPQHVHSDAYNVVVYGAKRWFLWAPGNANYTRTHPLRFVRDDIPNMSATDRPLECYQNAGDLLYVPWLWGHAVLNQHETVGLAVEFIYRKNLFGYELDG